jgi:ATP-dependent DNA helicase RecQ
VLAKPLVAQKKREIGRRQKAKRESEWSGVDQELFEALRRKRADLAEKQGVPAYIIFGDRSLKDMAAKRPSTREEFADIFGVGEHKLKLYAKEFLRVIAQGQ